jgi:hypothetical protein
VQAPGATTSSSAAAAATFLLAPPAAAAYPRGTRLLHGSNRDYMLVPIGQVMDESYTAYFNFLPQHAQQQ